MKTEFTSALLAAALLLVVGCVSPRKGPAYGHEQEFRQQLAESIPVKKYGYSIKQLKFSDDYKKALVIFTHPDTKARPELEFVLASDEFGRYRGYDDPTVLYAGHCRNAANPHHRNATAAMILRY